MINEGRTHHGKNITNKRGFIISSTTKHSKTIGENKLRSDKNKTMNDLMKKLFVDVVASLNITTAHGKQGQRNAQLVRVESSRHG